MTPAARYAAAIDVLDRFLGGEPAEKLLSNWARANRYAGSKDRAAVRDIVFECLRNLRSYQAVAGFEGGRALAVGHCLAQDVAPVEIFGQSTYGPDPLTAEEVRAIEGHAGDMPDAVRLDVPDWMLPLFQPSLADKAEQVLTNLKQRAPVDLRVNLAKSKVSEALAALLADDIDAESITGSDTAVRVLRNPRRVAGSKAYTSGKVELQDAASQAVVASLPLAEASTILDYCAGGGGKSLAMAAITPKARLSAYDANAGRLQPLTERAKRAGAKITILRNRPEPSARAI